MIFEHPLQEILKEQFIIPREYASLQLGNPDETQSKYETCNAAKLVDLHNIFEARISNNIVGASNSNLCKTYFLQILQLLNKLKEVFSTDSYIVLFYDYSQHHFKTYTYEAVHYNHYSLLDMDQGYELLRQLPPGYPGECDWDRQHKIRLMETKLFIKFKEQDQLLLAKTIKELCNEK